LPYDAIDSERTAIVKPRPRIRWLAALGLVGCSIVAGLLVLEIGCRLLRGPQALLDWQNLALAGRIAAIDVDNPKEGSAFVHDDRLGFVNTAGYASPRLNYDSHGFRRTPPLPARAVSRPPILATPRRRRRSQWSGRLIASTALRTRTPS